MNAAPEPAWMTSVVPEPKENDGADSAKVRPGWLIGTKPQGGQRNALAAAEHRCRVMSAAGKAPTALRACLACSRVVNATCWPPGGVSAQLSGCRSSIYRP